MGIEATDTVSICIDCMMMHANGEAAESPDREPLGLLSEWYDISLGLPRDDHSCHDDSGLTAWDRGDECECENLGFSWSACEGCGDRFAMTVFSEVTA